MKFKFKTQQYQVDAVSAVTSVFNGQPFIKYEEYLLLTNPVETKTLEYRDYPEVKSIDFFFIAMSVYLANIRL